MRVFAKNAVVWISAAVMIFYGGSKVGDSSWLAQLEVMGGWDVAERAVGVWLPWVEIGLGFLLLSDGVAGRGARRCTALLLFGFLPFLVYFLLSGMTDCGCAGVGGGGVLSHPAFGIARNLVLGGGLLWAERFSPWPFSSFDRQEPIGHNLG